MTTATRPALRVVADNTAPLSQTYDAPLYRATAQDKPTWDQLTRSRGDCDECAALQHESHGKYGPRAKARQKRAFHGGPELLLCSAHALAWHDRDDIDTGAKKAGRRTGARR
ncbi:hypothetical protein A5789_22020 [Nocardia sp. 852002-51101_SCH5132738]|uniref:hypothetical protein n=1 Tax=Nocardia sp. 852002-51101_SCH5132738 TaxID=1834095 RepID=UPI0007EAF86F|nr:hypothetical protein [Nocardia sp. 852002-51101_SCH5132738]OBA54439.1 hypothetical protein A5789_22020 [Nocardia sp. 852002-51101_SCH5132738]